jgi:hypothetical protein
MYILRADINETSSVFNLNNNLQYQQQPKLLLGPHLRLRLLQQLLQLTQQHQE